MVNDDFSALDFLSAGGFRMTSGPSDVQYQPKKKRFALRRKAKGAGKRRLTELLPLLGRKAAKTDAGVMSGWPVALSWPSPEVDAQPNWDEAADRLHS
ncbi:MAG TPA: hypothetical protein VM661_15070 [Candidatus Sulfotelmatobacter sp.]|nr:hypothetical protein [Candidatus Sulfotelmatobacter sp.]